MSKSTDFVDYAKNFDSFDAEVGVAATHDSDDEQEEIDWTQDPSEREDKKKKGIFFESSFTKSSLSNSTHNDIVD